MKKLLVMVLMAVLCSASSALATKVLTNYTAATDGTVGAAVDGTAGPITIGSTPFSVSTNVNLIAAGGSGGYNVSSKHLSGDLNFISSSVSASIKETAATKGTKMTTIILPTGTDLYTGTGGY